MLHCHVSITLSKPSNSINIKQDNVCEASIELFENATYTAWKKKKKNVASWAQKYVQKCVKFLKLCKQK